MSPNSLFAVLLRSPWWISFALVGVLSLAAVALLPRDHAWAGALGTFPFFVVGCMAAWRQWRAPSAARVQAVLQQAAAMPWRQFAQRLEDAWRAEGHEVQRMNGPHCDLRITRGEQTLLVAARRYKAATHGVEPLRELQAEVQRQGARAGVYVALQGAVSEQARGFARDNALALLEGDALATLLLKATPPKT